MKENPEIFEEVNREIRSHYELEASESTDADTENTSSSSDEQESLDI